MGRKVNPTAFRLGLVTFWKSELYSQNFSSIFKDFLDFYRLLKIALRVFGLELLSSKILGLGKSKFLILANFYRYALYKPKFKWKSKRRRKKTLPPQPGTARVRLVKVKKRIGLKEIMFNLEHFFSIFLKKTVFVKLRSIFSIGYTQRWGFKNYSKGKGKLNPKFLPLRSSKLIYKKMRRFSKARFFEFLRDTVNVVNFSFLFVNSSILAYYLSKLIKFHKNVKYIIYKVKTIIEGFRLYHLDHSSIRVSVFGKIKGVSRTSSITFSCGTQWPLQTPTARLDYNLAQTWNIFGAYGVKVWIFNHMKAKALG